MNVRTRQQLKYILSDFLSLNVGWLCFNVARFFTLPSSLVSASLKSFLSYPQVIIGQLVIPLAMMALYAVSGSYDKGHTLYRSRLDEFLNAALISAFGTVGVFFAALVNDNIPERLTNYELLIILFGCLFVPVALCRFWISCASARRIRNGVYCVDTLIIGAKPEYGRKIERIQASYMSGLRPVACVAEDNRSDFSELNGLPVYSGVDIADLCRRLGIGAVVVMPSQDGSLHASAFLDRLYALGIPIFVSAELFTPVAMQPRVSGVINEPLVDITSADVSPAVTNMKRLGDILVSALALVALSPIYLFLALAVRLDSPGPVFYRQERVGYRKKLFKIIKFRSMCVDAEPDGCPRLSTGDADSRVTRFGRFMRKYRLDELPQFWNVLIGDMSLVGPRPERKYYLDLLAERIPWHGLIHQVRPGITSWGMVKYGYASTIDEMVERAPYDMLYIRNISFPVDLKIVFHTVSTIFGGRGM